MSKIRFVTDSAADIPADLVEKLDILVLPFMIAIGDNEYRDGIDFTHQDFYKYLLECDKIPTHSQLNPTYILSVYEEAYSEGYSDLIYTCINAKGSATFQNLQMARNLFYEEHPEAKDKFIIHTLDSKGYTYAYGYCVTEGAKMAAEGKPVNEILAYMQDWIDNYRILFATYSLKFAKKSGRVSAAAAFLGEALGMKPIMSFPDGDSKVLSKVRGDKAVIPAIIKMMKAEIEPGSPYTVILACDEERNREMTEAAKEALGYDAACAAYVGGVIAINAGPNLTGIIYRKRK